MSDAVPVAPAATVMVMRDGPDGVQTLMVRRHAKLAFHGGGWVFPGGRVDDGDRRGADDDDHAARMAGIREVREETGLDLDPVSLVPLSHWTTPPGPPRRFATWFFMAAAGDRSPVTVDGEEITAHRWITLQGALDEHAAGELQLAPPQYVTLLGLADVASVSAAEQRCRGRRYMHFTPRIVPDGDTICCLYPGDVAYDDDAVVDDRGALDVEGPRHRLTIRGNDFTYEAPDDADWL